MYSFIVSAGRGEFGLNFVLSKYPLLILINENKINLIERYPSLNSDCAHLIVLLLSILLVCIYVWDGVYEYLCVYVCVCLFTSVFVSVYLRVYGDCIRIFFAFKTLPSP